MSIDASTLGGTLYVPGIRNDLLAVISGQRYPALRSVVICLEDAIAAADVPRAMANIKAVLGRLSMQQSAMETLPLRPALFVRPRNPEMLEAISHLPGAGCIDGYVIPKATADVLPAYLIGMHLPHQYILPTIETREAFDPAAMRRLREQLVAVQERVLTVRIGGNDLLQTLGTRRSPKRTAYDGPLGHVIASLVATFVPWNFAMSAPVFESFSNEALLFEEIERDLEHGLFTKTAIHPGQVAAIHAAYRVAPADHEAALAVVASGAPAVFAVNGAMCEPATHLRWACATLCRADAFGLSPLRHDDLSLAS